MTFMVGQTRNLLKKRRKKQKKKKKNKRPVKISPLLLDTTRSMLVLTLGLLRKIIWQFVRSIMGNGYFGL